MPARLIGGVLLLLMSGLLAGRLVLFTKHSLDLIAFPWQVDFDEGVILHSSWLLAEGQNPYPINTPDHFVSSVYPPVFYALNALALKLWGLNLWSGRALSLFGTIMAAFSVLWWTWTESRSRIAGVVAAAVWLSLGPVIVWATFYKQDILALGFGILGGAMLAASMQPEPGGKSRWKILQATVGNLPWLAWLAILPLTLACWTKQSALATLIASSLYLFLYDRRLGLRWSILAGIVLILPFLALNWLLQGQLYNHMTLPGAEVLSVSRLLKNTNALWIEHWPLVLIAAATTIYLLSQAIRNGRAHLLSVWYALFSLPILMVTNLSPLANYNHILDGLLPVCLLVGIGLGHLQKTVASAPTWKLLPLAGGATLLIVVQGVSFTPVYRWYSPLAQPLNEKAGRMAAMEREIAATAGNLLLTEDIWLALKAGKSLIPFDDTAQMAAQAASGNWDQSLLLATIAERNFPLIVLEQDIAGEIPTVRWSPDALRALQTNYVTRYRDVRFIEVPMPVPDAPTTGLMCALPGGPVLEGYFLPGDATQLKAGSSEQLSLYWSLPLTESVQETGSSTLKFSARLTGAKSAPIWQADLELGAASGQAWPQWKPGTIHRDDVTVLVPETAAPGKYMLTVSAYLQKGAELTPIAFACPAGVNPEQLVLASPQVGKPWGR